MTTQLLPTATLFRSEGAATESRRAGDIIRRLRDFVARGETERAVESLPKLVQEATALALVGAREHDIRIHFSFDPAIDLVLVDKVQIQQVEIGRASCRERVCQYV